MPITPDAVGATSKPAERAWDPDDCLLYALGVGAGVDELPFTTENTAGVAQQVLPTMAVVLSVGGLDVLAEIGTFDWAQLVHAEQGFELLGTIPPSGAVRTVSEITGIYDKGKAALVVLEARSVDATSGEPCFNCRTSLFIRGEGGWGGDPGPSASRPEAFETDPHRVVTYRTREDQALLYRLSGDRNPLHSDPGFAARAGFDRPILHGMCTYGFAGRALLHTVCGGDPARFRSMEGRFTAPVFPGDELETRIWLHRDEAFFQAVRPDGTVVIDNGRCRFDPEDSA